MKKNLKGRVLKIEGAAKDTVRLEFSTELNEIRAGQFVSFLIPNKTFRRPFSVSNFEKLYQGGKITILFKLKGEGTNYLKSLKEGDELDYLGPLGNGFSEFDPKKRALLVGAGIGIAPMLYLKKVLNEKNMQNFLITGFRSEEEAVEGSDTTVIGGSVLDNIQDLIDEYKPDIIYSCGPKIVLETVCEIAEKNNLPAQIAMEKVMACGIGVCRGCAVKIKDGDRVKMAAVCKDGPVFNGPDIVWEGV